MSLTTKIREYRARDKLSQEELAQKVGVRRETIGNLENGKYNPSLKLAICPGQAGSRKTPPARQTAPPPSKA